MTRSRKRKLNRSRPALLSMQVASTLLAGAGSAFAQEASPAADSQGLEEIVVTAQKRSENLQSVPISIEALDSKHLEDLHITDFDSAALYLPSVSFQTLGPSQAQIYFRGVTNGSDGLKVGSSPMVGVYLDEQPVTTIGTSLDIHVYDMQRIEALAGPQGTLFGASSMAGTIRYITNKPDPSANSAGYDLTAIHIAHGGSGEIAEGFVNLALSDNAAIRLVGYSERDPGYIDNVAGPPETYPTSGVPRDNSQYQRNDYNNVGTEGGRAALKVNLADGWSILPSLIYQKQGANGSFAYEQTLGYLNVATYEPMRNDDQWYQAALTVQGRIGNLDLVYSGAYMRRTIHNVVDYSDYSYAYDSYYDSIGLPQNFGDYFENAAGQPISPAQKLVSYDLLSYRTHELRLSSDPKAPFRYVVGAFYEDQGDNDQYRYLVADLAPDLSITGQPGVHYENTIVRKDVNRALFTDMSYDFSPAWTLTAGVRVFDYQSDATGFFGFNGDYAVGEVLCNPAETPAGVNSIEPCQNVNHKGSGANYTDRLTLSHKLDADKMVYATYSTGYRQGGFNRNPEALPYHPDFLSNYELGWKTSWAGHTLRFNGAFFREDWRDPQYGVSGPYSITQIVNAGAARTEGIESSLEWLMVPGLTLMGSGTYLWQHELTEDACIIYSPKPNCALASGVPNISALAGTTMPVAPTVKANLTLRYEFMLANLLANIQGGGVYEGASRSVLPTVDEGILGPMSAYTTFNLSAGLAHNSWTTTFSISNLFNSDGEVSRYLQCNSAFCNIPYIIPLKPRTLMLQFGQRF
jgi:iron complex outermembrane recepter protein